MSQEMSRKEKNRLLHRLGELEAKVESLTTAVCRLHDEVRSNGRHV